jgi:arylformamidase
MTPRILDISQTLHPDLPVWSGDTAFAVERTWALSEDCPVNVSRLTLSTHTGAHADAPLHYAAGGADMAAVGLVPYLGPVQVIDVTACGARRITPQDLAGRLRRETVRLILRTFVRFPHDRWPQAFATPSPPLIDALAAQGGLLIGIDAPSLDPETSKDLPAHQAVARHGLAILEGLVLDDVDEGHYELIALPLKLAGADASPVRAVLRTLGDGLR